MRRFLLLVVALWVLPIGSAVAAPQTSPELLDAIAASWRKDPVYVFEGLQVPPAELNRIRAATRSLDTPVYVALLPSPSGEVKQRRELPTLLQARIGGNGLFLVWLVDDDDWRGEQELVLPLGSKADDRFREVRRADDAYYDLVDERPAPTVVRRIQQVDAALSGAALPAIPTEDLRPKRRPGLSNTDKEDRAAFTGMGVGAFITCSLMLLRFGRRASRSLRSDARLAAEKASPVTAESLAQQTDAMISQADRARQRLERRIAKGSVTAEQLDRRDDAVTRLEAARSLREEDGIEAAAGAFVLARQAYTGLTEGVVRPPCFFNPTHLAGTATVVWSDLEVPACKVCQVAVDAGDEPLSLRVPVAAGLFGKGSADAPYWSAESVNPFVLTGFGALSDDLAERVMER